MLASIWTISIPEVESLNSHKNVAETHIVKKEKKIFLIYKAIQNRAVIYKEGLPNTVYEEMRKYFTIFEEAVGYIWLCNLIFEENPIFFFISSPIRKGCFSPINLKTTAHAQWNLKQTEQGHGPIWKGGSAAITEYVCSRIAQMEAVWNEKVIFSDERVPLQSTHLLLEFLPGMEEEE